MKVGIIVHSYTGHTLSVAERLREKLASSGHQVSIERVIAVNEDPSNKGTIELKTSPEINTYDVLLFGAPVRGFSLSPAMKHYLSQLSSLAGKKIGCFITQQFPYPWMGGNQTVKQLKKICEAKGQIVSESGIVNWSHKEREKKITDVLEKLTNIK